MFTSRYEINLYTLFGLIVAFKLLRSVLQSVSRYSDSLRNGRSGNGIPVFASFSATVQTGPGAYPVLYKMSTGSLP